MGSATRQGRLWGAAAQDWAELQEPLALPLWEAMLDAAAVGPGTRVLDAGCGAGGASVVSAGPGAPRQGPDRPARLLRLVRGPGAAAGRLARGPAPAARARRPLRRPPRAPSVACVGG